MLCLCAHINLSFWEVFTVVKQLRHEIRYVPKALKLFQFFIYSNHFLSFDDAYDSFTLIYLSSSKSIIHVKHI